MAPPALGHEGRRFQIEVANGPDGPQLVARGVNTQAGNMMDPQGFRPYNQAAHGHWEQLAGFVETDLPGYDLGAGTTVLQDHDVTWTLTGVQKWSNVSASLKANPTPEEIPLGLTLSGMMLGMPAFVEAGTVPNFQPLALGESIEIVYDGGSVSTADLGTAASLSHNLVVDYDGGVTFDANGFAQGPSNGFDLDLIYEYTDPGNPGDPAGYLDTLYVLESVLSTDADGIADSETIYTIISPDGVGPVNRLHFAALFLEERLGTPIPEPTTGLVLAMSGGLLLLRRRRA
ncbi:MAG: PEP-CTERM sorting domain-containing protein [Planctomycetota bacterium]